MFLGSAILHFIFVEQRCLFLAWYGAHSTVIKGGATLFRLFHAEYISDCTWYWTELCHFPPGAENVVTAKDSIFTQEQDGSSAMLHRSQDYFDKLGLNHSQWNIWWNWWSWHWEVDLNETNLGQWWEASNATEPIAPIQRGPLEAEELMENWIKNLVLTPALHTYTYDPTTLNLNIGGPLYMLGSGVFALFFIANMANLFRNGFYRFNEGGYMIFTWRLECMLYHRIFAGTLAVLIIGGLAVALLVTAVVLPHLRRLTLKALWLTKLDIAVMLTGLLPLILRVGGHACAKTSDFKLEKFNRSLRDLFVQSNDAFAVVIEDAIIKYLRGDRAPLEALVDAPADFMDIALQSVDSEVDSETEDKSSEHEDEMSEAGPLKRVEN